MVCRLPITWLVVITGSSVQPAGNEYPAEGAEEEEGHPPPTSVAPLLVQVDSLTAISQHNHWLMPLL